jgi:hypothetical protein
MEDELLNEDLVTLDPNSPLKVQTETENKLESTFNKEVIQNKLPKKSKWEIPVDKTKPSFTAERKVLNKKYGELKIVEVCNVMKEFGKEAKILLRYNSGQRDWCGVGPCITECTTMLEEFMNNNDLTWEKLGYTGEFPEEIDDNNTNKEKEAKEEHNEEVTTTKEDTIQVNPIAVEVKPVETIAVETTEVVASTIEPTTVEPNKAEPIPKSNDVPEGEKK